MNAAETSGGQYVSSGIMDAWESGSQDIVFWSSIDTISAVSYKSANEPRAGESRRIARHPMDIPILIADDNDDNRELLRLLLSGAGYIVREARDGNECLAIARHELPGLIVMDLSMPVMDGWAVFEELKADDRTRAIPCMIVTAHAELERSAALETGFVAYVSKPFSNDHLLKTVAAVLANRRAVDQL